MAGGGAAPKLVDLLGELYHRGAITVTTPEQGALTEHGALDLVTVIQLDGVVITHVSEQLLRDRQRLDACLGDHQERVARALAPLTDLGRASVRFERAFMVALMAIPQIGWIVNAVHIHRSHGDFKGWTSLMLFMVGAVGAPLGYAVRGYAQRLFGRLVRFGASRALPAVATKLLGAGRG